MGTKIVNLNFSIFSELEFVSSETQFSKLLIYFDKKKPRQIYAYFASSIQRKNLRKIRNYNLGHQVLLVYC